MTSRIFLEQRMNKFLAKLGVAVGMSVLTLAAGEAAQAYTLNGTVDAFSVDYEFFSTSGGGLTIAVDRDDSGPTNPLDDPMIRVFENDGSPVGALTGTLVATDDDDGPGLNSFLDLPSLVSGDYVLAISNFFLSESEARLGVADRPSVPGDYVATFTGDTTPTVAASVPEPTAAVASGLMMLGALAVRKRKGEATEHLCS